MGRRLLTLSVSVSLCLRGRTLSRSVGRAVHRRPDRAEARAARRPSRPTALGGLHRARDQLGRQRLRDRDVAGRRAPPARRGRSPTRRSRAAAGLLARRRWLAFVSDRTDTRQLYRLSLAGGEAESARPSGEEGVTAFAWSPDGTPIAYTMTDPVTAAMKERKEQYGEFTIEDQDARMAQLHVVDVATTATRAADVGRVRGRQLRLVARRRADRLRPPREQRRRQGRHAPTSRSWTCRRAQRHAARHARRPRHQSQVVARRAAASRSSRRWPSRSTSSRTARWPSSPAERRHARGADRRVRREPVARGVDARPGSSSPPRSARGRICIGSIPSTQADRHACACATSGSASRSR